MSGSGIWAEAPERLGLGGKRTYSQASCAVVTGPSRASLGIANLVVSGCSGVRTIYFPHVAWSRPCPAVALALGVASDVMLYPP